MTKEKYPEWKDVAFTEYGGAKNITTKRYSYTEWIKESNNGNLMLFDHKKDPEENVNVADRPEYRAVADSLKIRLKKLYESINDRKNRK